MLLMVSYIIVVVLLLLYSLHKYTSRNFDYWKKRNIPYLKPNPFVGNLLDVCLRRCDIGHQLEKLYNQCNAPFFGAFAFSQPILIVKDTEIIKNVLIKDFDCFVNRNVLASEHDPATAHMTFVEKGDEWKIMRSAITPFFSTNKLKNMFGAIDDIAKCMQNYIEIQNRDGKSLEAKELSCLYSTDVIAKCAFGINANSFTNDNAEFRIASGKLFDSRFITTIRLISYFFLHPFAKIFRFDMFDPNAITFLEDVLWQTMKIRETENIVGNDFLNIILELKRDDKFRRTMKFEGRKLIAQALNFFVAGFETIASTISFALYELCLNTEVQKKLRSDIEKTLEKWNGELKYESLTEIEYLDWIVKETLRKYPVLPYLDRVCNTDYRIPGTNHIIEKGVIVMIPMIGLHCDPELYPDPEKFIPERFKTHKRDCSYLPFGRGPRICAGERLGLLATKLALIRTLLEFEVLKSEETPVPLVYKPSALLLASSNGLPMRFKRRDK